MDFLTNPMAVPIVGIVTGTIMIVAIVGIVNWHKAREKELQFHQELRLREMEHQVKMKQLEIELEKAKGSSSSSRAA